jgi:hypothetical protein
MPTKEEELGCIEEVAGVAGLDEDRTERTLAALESGLAAGDVSLNHSVVGSMDVMVARIDNDLEDRAIVFKNIDEGPLVMSISLWRTDGNGVPISQGLVLGIVKREDSDLLLRVIRLITEGMKKDATWALDSYEDMMELLEG